MKTLIQIAILFLAFRGTAEAQAQAYRVDPVPVLTTNGSCVSGKQCPASVVPGATITVCNYPSCVTPVTTYTDSTAVTPCPSYAQVTQANSTQCTSTTGSQGQFGFWLQQQLAMYKITLPTGQQYGPFPLSIGPVVGGAASAIGFEPTGGTVQVNVASALNSAFLYDIGYDTFAHACAASIAAGKALAVTQVWAAIPTQSCAANLWFPLGSGGSLKPGSAQILTFADPATITGYNVQLFDESSGGRVRFSTSRMTSLNPMWYGAIPAVFTVAECAFVSCSQPDSYAAIRSAFIAAALNSPASLGVTFPSQSSFYTSGKVFAGDPTWTGSASGTVDNPQCFSGAIQCPMAAFTRGEGRWASTDTQNANLTALPSMTRAQFVFSAPGLFFRTVEDFAVSGGDVAPCFNGSFLIFSGAANINTYRNLMFSRCANSSVSPFYEVYLDGNNDSVTDNITVVPSLVETATIANPLGLHFQAEGGALGATSNLKLYDRALIYVSAQNSNISDSYLSGGVMMGPSGLSYLFTNTQIEVNPVSRHVVDVDPAAFAGPQGLVFDGGYLIPSGFPAGSGYSIFNGTYLNGARLNGTYVGPTTHGTTFGTITTPGSDVPLFEFENLTLTTTPEVSASARVHMHSVQTGGLLMPDSQNASLFGFDPAKPVERIFGGTHGSSSPGTVNLAEYRGAEGLFLGLSVDLNGLPHLPSYIVPLNDFIANHTVAMNESVIGCQAGSGGFTITLPTIILGAGKYFTIIKEDGTNNVCTIAVSGVGTIATMTIGATARTFYDSGAAYYEIGNPNIIPPTSCTGRPTGSLWNNSGTAAFCP